MAILTNATGRLHALLVKAVEIPSPTTTRDAWRQLLNVESKYEGALLTALGAAVMLPSQAEAEIRRLDDPEPMLVWTPAVHQAFTSMQLNGRWESFRTFFDSDKSPLVALNIAANAIARRFPQPALEVDVLADIREQVREVREEVLASDLPPDLKELILNNLREIDSALDAYAVRGPAGLRDVVERISGAALTRPDVWKKAGGDAARQSFGRLLERVVLVVSLSADVTGLGTFVDQYLLNDPATISVTAPSVPDPEPPVPPDPEVGAPPTGRRA